MDDDVEQTPAFRAWCYHRPDGQVHISFRVEGEPAGSLTMDPSEAAEMGHAILLSAARELTLRRWLRIWWERR